MSSRTKMLLAGAVAFAAVFALIIGGTVAFLVLRGGAGGGDRPTASATSIDTTVPATDPVPTPDPEITPTGEAEFCWYNAEEKRTSVDPSGRIAGGGLQMAVPQGIDWQHQTSLPYVPALDDVSVITTPVDENWVALMAVGGVVWQPGYEFPGTEKAAQRVVDCFAGSSGPWDSMVSKRHVESTTTEAVEIGGLSGHRTDAVLVFDQHKLTKTSGTILTAIVLDVPDGPALFFSDIPRENTNLQAKRDAAIQTLVVV